MYVIDHVHSIYMKEKNTEWQVATQKRQEWHLLHKMETKAPGKILSIDLTWVQKINTGRPVSNYLMLLQMYSEDINKLFRE